jgi:hypothetical protein
MTNALAPPADDSRAADSVAAEAITDVSWDARTQRMMAKMGAAPPRPRDFARRSRSPSVARTHRLNLGSQKKLALSQQNSLSPRYGAGAGENRKERRCENTGKNLKQAVPAKSSLGMAAVGVMSTSIGRAGAAAGARLGYEGMQLGSQALISLLDIAEVQLVAGAVFTVLLWEASSRKFTKNEHEHRHIAAAARGRRHAAHVQVTVGS